jgi:hypothetical protein
MADFSLVLGAIISPPKQTTSVDRERFSRGVGNGQDEDRYGEGACGCLWMSVFGIKITTALPSL